MDYFKLLISIGLCLLIGFTSSIWTSESISSWYKNINKPSFNPPNYLFGPVWTVLYVMMGISLYLVWTTGPTQLSIILFASQLVLNFFWSFLFFKLQNPLLAFIEITILLGTIIATAIVFYPISRTAALLFIPYILGVSFATILNLSIYLLNK